MKRYFLELAYKGTNYHGWQIQANAMTVQQHVNRALSTVFRSNVETIGAGRTDTGVHARQMFAHFDVENEREDFEKILHTLNAIMPHDISAKRLIAVHGDAHARFDATSRSYEYRIHFEKNPFLNDLSWRLKDVPDIEKMNKSAAIMLGYTDFSSFSKSNTQVFTNNCQISSARWIWKNESKQLIFEITADRFLRNMVRAIVGTLLEIGHGKNTVEHIRTVIESENRAVAGRSVPACGLYLNEVNYPYLD